MQLKTLVCGFLFFFSLTLYSQTVEDSIDYKEDIVRLHILPLGIGLERPLCKNATILMDFGAGFSFLIADINGNRKSIFKLFPYISIEPRIYTNLNERKEKGKRIDYFSGSYGSFKFQGGMDLDNGQWYIQLGPLVGIQRTFGKRVYFSLGAGVASTIIKDDVKFGLIGDIKFGFILN